jgi:hypothetical protein
VQAICTKKVFKKETDIRKDRGRRKNKSKGKGRNTQIRNLYRLSAVGRLQERKI